MISQEEYDRLYDKTRQHIERIYEEFSKADAKGEPNLLYKGQFNYILRNVNWTTYPYLGIFEWDFVKYIILSDPRFQPERGSFPYLKLEYMFAVEGSPNDPHVDKLSLTDLIKLKDACDKANVSFDYYFPPQPSGKQFIPVHIARVHDEHQLEVKAEDVARVRAALNEKLSTKPIGEQTIMSSTTPAQPACTISVDPSVAFQNVPVVYGVPINAVKPQELLNLLGKLKARRDSFANVSEDSKYIKKRIKEINIAEAKVLAALDKHA